MVHSRNKHPGYKSVRNRWLSYIANCVRQFEADNNIQSKAFTNEYFHEVTLEKFGIKFTSNFDFYCIADKNKYTFFILKYGTFEEYYDTRRT